MSLIPRANRGFARESQSRAGSFRLSLFPPLRPSESSQSFLQRCFLSLSLYALTPSNSTGCTSLCARRATGARAGVPARTIRALFRARKRLFARALFARVFRAWMARSMTACAPSAPASGPPPPHTHTHTPGGSTAWLYEKCVAKACKMLQKCALRVKSRRANHTVAAAARTANRRRPRPRRRRHARASKARKHIHNHTKHKTIQNTGNEEPSPPTPTPTPPKRARDRCAYSVHAPSAMGTQPQPEKTMNGGVLIVAAPGECYHS